MATAVRAPLFSAPFSNLRKSAGALNDNLEVAGDSLKGVESVLQIAILASSHKALPVAHAYIGTLRSGIDLYRAGVTWAEVAGGSLNEALSAKKFFSLVLRTLLLVGRTLSALLWIDHKHPFLGEHAKGMGTAVSCIFTAVNGVGFVQSVHNYYAPHLQFEGYKAVMLRELPESMDREAEASLYAARRRSQAKTACLNAFLDLICSPWDCGILHSHSFAAKLVGSILNFIGSVVKIYNHWNFYDLATAPVPETPVSGAST